MKAVLKKDHGLKKDFEVTITSAEIETRRTVELEKLSAKVKIDGFRPGKVPMHVVKQKYGQSVIADVLDGLVRDTINKAIAENKLRPALEPVLDETDQFEEGKDFSYKFSVEVFPEVPEINVDKIAISKQVVDITETEVNEGIARIVEGNRTPAKLAKPRAAKTGDVVVFDFTGSKDGVEFPGGKAENFRLGLGSGQFIPGFEEQLTGMNEGESKTFDITFPADYHAPDLAGAKTQFAVKINEILEMKDPAIDDEFAKKLGFKDLVELRAKIEEQIKKDFEGISYSKQKKQLFDAIDENFKFDVPQGMIDMDYKPVLEQLQRDPEQTTDVESEAKRLAERRVRLGIILSDLARKNTIQPTNDEIRQAVWNKATLYPGQEKKVIEFYQKNANALDQVRGEILEDKVVQFLLSKAKVTETKVSTKELLEEETDSKPAKTSAKKKTTKKED